MLKTLVAIFSKPVTERSSDHVSFQQVRESVVIDTSACIRAFASANALQTHKSGTSWVPSIKRMQYSCGACVDACPKTTKLDWETFHPDVTKREDTTMHEHHAVQNLVNQAVEKAESKKLLVCFGLITGRIWWWIYRPLFRLKTGTRLKVPHEIKHYLPKLQCNI